MVEWLSDLYMLVAENKIDPAINLLFDKIDDLLCAGEFATVDQIIQVIDLTRLDSNLLVGLLSITYAASDKLKKRDWLVSEIEKQLYRIVPERAHRLVERRR